MSIRKQLESLALASLTDEECPGPDRLAQFILGELSGNDELQVAAHVRQCTLCQEDVRVCRPPQPRPKALIAQFVPSFATGVRSATAAQHIRQYRVADLVIELTISNPDGDRWRITGQLLRADEGVPHQPVQLRPKRKRALTQQSDEDGFFTFDDLVAGQYTLLVDYAGNQVQVRGLDLQQTL